MTGSHRHYSERHYSERHYSERRCRPPAANLLILSPQHYAELVSNLDRSPAEVVPGHPHTGLQTVSWLFTGEVEHRDTTGAHAFVRPGQLNLMTAGSGIAHSEYSTPATTVLHGAQLWIALPAAHRFAWPGFAHYEPPLIDAAGSAVRVFIGALFGQASPVPVYSPLAGAEVTIAPGHTLDVPVEPGYEHGLLCDTGSVASVGRTGSAPDAWQHTLPAPDLPSVRLRPRG